MHTVTVTGTAGATTGVVTGSGMNYTVSVSGMVSNGTITVSIAAGVAHDAGNNPNTASTSADDTVTFDTLAPSVTIDKKAGQADPTNASPVLFTVTFSEAVTGFVTGDVTLGGTANPTTATVTPVSAWRRANTIWASVNLVFFMAIAWVLRYDKCPIFSALQWPSLMGGGQATPCSTHNWRSVWEAYNSTSFCR